MKLRSVARAVACGVSVVALIGSTGAFAQETAPQPAEEEGEAIVVTGSRIARPDLDSAVPLAAIGEAAIQQDAAVNIQDTLNELPQIGIGTSRTNSNFLTGANGVATVNLRNLGEDRTLVLVNGRRFIAGLAGSSAVDINNIPPEFVERIDIVTGGSSAVYGSEAISGVVNFILKDKFEGIEARGQYGITERGDNAKYVGSITAGQSFADGRGNIIANFTYDKDEGLLSRKRGISDQDCFLNASADECGPAFYSSYAAQGRFQFLGVDSMGMATEPEIFNGQNIFTFDPGNNVVTGFPTGSGFNRNGVRRISVPVERYLGSAIANFEISDGVTLYAEGTYAKVKSSSQIEATPLDFADLYDGTPGNLGLPLTNPFIPASVQAAIAAANSDADPDNDVLALGFRRRQNEVFSRSNTAERDTYRIAVGVKGNIFSDFNYDVSYVYGRLKDFTASQDIDNARYRQSLDAITVGGQIVCRDPAARAAGCVPINIFGFNTASPEASAFVQSSIPKSEKITNQQHVASASVSGDLFELPGGKLGVAVGAEYRKEKSVDDLDDLTNTGGNSGNLIPDTRGSYDVWEVFGEVNAPILSDRSFFNYLGLTGAVRYSDYSTVGSVFSWNAGVEYSPFEGLRFRGSYAEANRAPNIGELFSAPSETFPTVSDPCEGVSATTAPSTTTSAQATACRALPGFAANVNQANNPTPGQFFYDLADIQGINGFDGGNLNLQEETAKTLTFGGIIQPPQIPGLSLSVDYFRIKVQDAIDTTPRDISIGQCLETGDAAFCNNVIRAAANGRLLTINSQLANIADLKTSGIDVALQYNRPLGLMTDDRLTLNVYYTYLISLEKRAFADAPLEENRGQLDGEGRLGAGFKHKASARIGYEFDGVTLSWQTNYLGKIQDTLGGYGDDEPELNRLNSVGARFYHDVQARFAAGPDEKFEFYVGVDNLFDKGAPFLPSGFASSITGTETAADTYDPFGRRYYAGARVRF